MLFVFVHFRDPISLVIPGRTEIDLVRRAYVRVLANDVKERDNGMEITYQGKATDGHAVKFLVPWSNITAVQVVDGDEIRPLNLDALKETP